MKESKDYLGKHMLPLSDQELKSKYSHPIFLYNGDRNNDFYHLDQIVNVYEHNLADFWFNSKKIIKHYKKCYGDRACGLYTLGQSIRFRVYEGEKNIHELSLFSFFVNYTMMIPLVLMGVDMHEWTPLTGAFFTDEKWEDKINQFIRKCRPYGNVRQLDDYLVYSKYLLNLFASEAGDKLALSISNNDFIELTKRNDEVRKTITCTFDIPKNVTPAKLETIAKNRTNDLLNFISDQSDLALSIYTKNGLFNRRQFQEFAVHLGYKPDLAGNTIPFTYPTNNIMGLKDPRAFIVDACGGRKAEVIKLAVSKAGALERSLCMLMSGVKYVDIDYECDSKHFRKKTIKNLTEIDKLEGRVATFDPDSDEYFIVDPDDTGLIGKTIYLKTPITCTHPDRNKGTICSACYGKLMGALNRDIHIGRLAAINSSDDIEQTLLSAKHALNTNTNEVEFTASFDQYFVFSSCQISFNQDMIDASEEDDSEFKHLHLEFHPNSIGKRLDGETRHYDRIVPEIIVFNDQDESRTVITELNGTTIYMSPEFVEGWYLPAIKFKDKDDVVHIPFTDIIEKGKLLCDVIFEYQYKNNELADPINELKDILTNGGKINSYDTYDDCLDYLIPLFAKGGIHQPDLQTELLVSQIIFTPDGKPVDWTEENPEYKFFSVDKAIQNNPSALVSLLYSETSQQIAGAHNTYSKSGTSAYDRFILNTNDNLDEGKLASTDGEE